MNNIRRKLAAFAAGLGLAVAAGTASADAILFDQWYEFKFIGSGPADPLVAGAGTVPGIGSIYAGDPAWTFVCPAGGCTLFVTDAFLSIDRFEIFDFGSSLGTTTAPTPGGLCDNDQLCALLDSNYSRGIFALGAGGHSITGIHTQGSDGAGFFFVGVAEVVPEPSSLLLIGAGLLLLVGLRRRA